MPSLRSQFSPSRAGAPLLLCAALLLAAAAPAAAVTQKEAAQKALASLDARAPSGSAVVFGATKSLRARSRVTSQGAKRSKRLVLRAGNERSFLFYRDLTPLKRSRHRGQAVLVGARSGVVTLSRTTALPLLVNGKLPLYKRVHPSTGVAPAGQPQPTLQASPFAGGPLANGGSPDTPNSPPRANDQTVRARTGVPKSITLTATDDDGEDLDFQITHQPDHGTLTGHPPDVVYTSAPGYVGRDDFAFKAQDFSSQSNTAHVSINVVPLGLPPTVATSSGCTDYVEETAAVVVDAGITTSDPDDTTLDGATVRVAANHQNGDDLLFTDQNGIVGAFDDNTGVLSLSGTASLANYQAALRSVRYRNLSNGSPSATKGVEFVVNDGGSNSAPATKQVCITENGATNRPTAGTSEGALSYTENDGPVAIDGLIDVSDPDSAELSGATVKFTNSQGSEEEETDPTGPGGTTPGFVPSEDSLALGEQPVITASYDSEAGVLTLTGTASVADYQTALRAVTYENSSEDPSDVSRLVRFQLTDTSGRTSVPSSRLIFVTPVNDAPTVTTSDGATAYSEGDPLTAVDPDLVVGDVDDTDIEGGQVRISDGFEPGDELGFTEQPGITQAYDSDTGVLTLTGTASVADYQAAMRAISFSQTGDNPGPSRTVEFTVNDGELDSSAATKDIAVAGVNDKPVLDTTDDALSYTENGGPGAIDPGITATDPDSATLQGATIRISSNFSAGEDRLGFEDQAGITHGYDDELGVLTLSGEASVADYEAALRTVTYENVSDNPTPDARTIAFQVDDGGAVENLSDEATRDVGITPVNDAPEVTTTDGSTSYVVGDPAATIDSSVSVFDVDDANLESAQVRISSGFEAGDELVLADQPGIDEAYDADTGVLTLTGSAPAGDYELALQSVGYSHTGENPAPSKTVEFSVNDGDTDSAAASKSLDVSTPPTGEAPVVTTSDGSTSYSLADTTGVAVDGALTVTDADDTNLESAQVQIVGFEPGDDLAFAPQLGISGNFDSEVGVLSLTGPAPVADYETALRSVLFRHFGDNVEASRTVEFKANDGDFDSNVASKSIDLVP